MHQTHIIDLNICFCILLSNLKQLKKCCPFDVSRTFQIQRILDIKSNVLLKYKLIIIRRIPKSKSTRTYLLVATLRFVLILQQS